MTGVVVNAMFSLFWLWLMCKNALPSIVVVRGFAAIMHAVMVVVIALAIS